MCKRVGMRVSVCVSMCVSMCVDACVAAYIFFFKKGAEGDEGAEQRRRPQRDRQDAAFRRPAQTYM